MLPLSLSLDNNIPRLAYWDRLLLQRGKTELLWEEVWGFTDPRRGEHTLETLT